MEIDTDFDEDSSVSSQKEKIYKEPTEEDMIKLSKKIKKRLGKKHSKKKYKKAMNKAILKKFNITYKEAKKRFKPIENEWKFEKNQAFLYIDGRWLYPITPQHKVEANRQYKEYLKEIIAKGYVPTDIEERLVNWTARNVKVDYEANPDYWNDFVVGLAFTNPDQKYWFLEFGYKRRNSLKELSERYPEFDEYWKYAKSISTFLDRSGLWNDVRFKELTPKDRAAYMKLVYANDKKSEFRQPDKNLNVKDGGTYILQDSPNELTPDQNRNHKLNQKDFDKIYKESDPERKLNNGKSSNNTNS